MSGLALLEAGGEKTLSPKSLRANCLCRKHNSLLSPLDDAAQRLFRALKAAFEADTGFGHVLVSGHDIERWFLKTAKAMSVSKNLARGREPLSGAFARDAEILEMLDAPASWPVGAGLYCVMAAGDKTINTPRFQLQPYTNVEGEIEMLALNVLGLVFVLLPEKPDIARHPFLGGASYRPGRIFVSQPASTYWLTMSWEDSSSRPVLTMQFVRAAERRIWCLQQNKILRTTS